MPTQIYSQMPRFDGFNICEGNAHVQRFHSFMKKHLFREEDMCMRFFVRSLDARAKDWYSSFLEKSFACWGELVGGLMEEFAREPADLVEELSQIRRQDEKTSVAFSHRFASALSQIPEGLRPNTPICISMYFEAFEEGSSGLMEDLKIVDMQMAYDSMDIMDRMRHEYIRNLLSTNLNDGTCVLKSQTATWMYVTVNFQPQKKNSA